MFWFPSSTLFNSIKIESVFGAETDTKRADEWCALWDISPGTQRRKGVIPEGTRKGLLKEGLWLSFGREVRREGTLAGQGHCISKAGNALMAGASSCT